MSLSCPSLRPLCGLIWLVLFVVFSSASAATAAAATPSLLTSIRWVDWTDFPSEAARDAYQTDRVYENLLLAGVKSWSPLITAAWPAELPPPTPLIFVSVPRWKNADTIPATLAVLNTTTQGRGGGYALTAWPPRSAQVPGHNETLQSVLGFEIDPYNRLWVLDMGRLNNGAALPGSIKLVIYDLLLGVELHRHVFPSSVASLSQSFLNDLVLDHERGFAYISDSSDPASGAQADFEAAIIVYSLFQDKSWRVLSKHYSTQPEWDFVFSVNGTEVQPGAPVMVGNDGIALTPDRKFLFYTALSSRKVYRVPACYLRNPNATVEEHVTYALLKDGNSDGLGMGRLLLGAPLVKDNTPVDAFCTVDDLTGATSYQLFTTDLEHAAVVAYTGDLSRVNVSNPAQGGSVTKASVLPTNIQALWPDTLGFDHVGNVLAMSNHLNAFTGGFMNFDETENFHLWSIPIPSTPGAIGVGDSYQAFQPDQIAFSFYYHPDSTACVGDEPAALHTAVSGVCLDTPSDGNSLTVNCTRDEQGRLFATFAATGGYGCKPGTAFGVGAGFADGVTCLPAKTPAGDVLGSVSILCPASTPAPPPASSSTGSSGGASGSVYYSSSTGGGNLNAASSLSVAPTSLLVLTVLAMLLQRLG